MAAGAGPSRARGFDLVERAVRGDVAPRLVQSSRCALRGARQTHGLGERLVDVAGRQPLQRAVVARIGIRRRALGAMHLDQRAELAPEVGPPAVLRTAAAKVGSKRLIIGDEVVEPNGLMRCGDDGRDGLLVLLAEAIDQQRLEISKRDAAIDRPPRSKGDDQCVGAPGETFGPLRRVLDLRKARFELGDLLAFAGG